MRSKNKKTLDEFFAKKNRSRKAKREICDISLCTATTRKEPTPTQLCTWKQNPDAFRPLSLRVDQKNLGDFLLMTMKEANTSKVRETTTSSLGGVTFGIAQLLYNQEEKEPSEGRYDERNVESLSARGLENPVIVRDEDESIEVSMNDIYFNIGDKSSVPSLSRKGTRLVEKAKLAEEKVRIEESKIMAKRLFLDFEHTEFQTILENLPQDILKTKEECKGKEIRLAESHRMLEEAYLEAKACLQHEEACLIEEKKRVVKEAQRVLEEALVTDSSSSLDIAVSLSTTNTLGALSENAWENDDEADIDDGENECLGKHHWKELDASEFKVRGKKYLTDKKKVSSGSNLFRLITIDLVEVSEPIMSGFCSHPSERVPRWFHREKFEKGNSTMPPFIFCVNMILPGPPHHHLVMYFGIDNLANLGLEKGSKKHPYSAPLTRFLFGSSDEYRNKTLKFIADVKEGGFLLKAAVGARPFILGKYMNQKFIRGDRYLEVIIDVGSSPTFQKLLKLNSNYKFKTTIAMAFILEAKDEECLPENVMCSVELTNHDFGGRTRFVQNADDASC